MASERDQNEALDVRQYESMDALPLGCEALFLAGERSSFDLSADWFRLFESKIVFRVTRFYVPMRDREVLGVLPLSLERVGAWTKQLNSLTCFYSSLYRPLLSPSITLDEFTLCLRKILMDVNADILRFDSMDPEHSTFEFLESAIHRTGLKSYRFFCFGNWYLPVDGRSFAEYFQGLTSQVRNTVKRREKKFLADGRGRLEIVTGSDRLPDLIEAWKKVYRASWKAPEPFPEFVPGLINACAARDWLRLGLAYYDGEPVAAQLWIVNHDRAAIYKLAYDENFAYLSPGTVLTKYLMRHVLDVDKVREVDYLTGEDAYKKNWMSHRRERWGIVAYNPHTLGGLISLAVQILGNFRRTLRKNRSAGSLPRIFSTKALNLNYIMANGATSEKKGWVILPLDGNLGTYKETWNQLNTELYSSHPYFDSNFIESLLTDFTTGKEKLCVHRRGADIDGLVIVTRLRPGKWSLFRPAQAQVVPLLVRCPENLQSLLFSLPGLPLGLDILCQDPLYSPLPDALRDLPLSPVLHAHTMGVNLAEAFKDYWATRPAKLRQNIGRRFRRVQDAGLAIRLKRLTESKEMQAAIARFGQMETAGWKGVRGTAVHSDNIQGHFYTNVMQQFAERGSATVYELFFNEILVAMQLCITSPSMLVLLKTTYDESHAAFSPGRLLLYLLLEEEFATKRVREVEFYTNADSDGLAWATHDRWISHYSLFRNKFVRSTYQVAKQLNHRLHVERQ